MTYGETSHRAGAGAENVRNKLDRTPRNWRLLGLGAVATVVTGFVGGYLIADKRATDARREETINQIVTNDGFTSAELVTGNPDTTGFAVLNVLIGECPLPATVTIVRDPEHNTVDATHYDFHALDPNKMDDDGFALPRPASGTNAQDIIAIYGENPCDQVMPSFEPGNL